MISVKEKTKNWWRQNLANLITASGIVFAFIFLVTAVLRPESIREQILLALFTAITDFIDGKIARDQNTVSILGSYMDRIRDRLFIFPGIIILSWQHREKITFPIIMAGLVASLVFFEAFIFWIGAKGYYWHRKGRDDINLQPSNSGKKKMFAGFSIILILLFSLYFECQGITFLKYSIWVIYLGLTLMVFWSYVSWQEYAQREIDLRKNKTQ